MAFPHREIYRFSRLHAGIFFLLALLLLSACSDRRPGYATVDLTREWDSTRVLENPGKGWYHHLHDNGAWRYEIRSDSVFHAFPGMDHIYIRLAWSYLEPEEGEYDWHLIDEVVEKYVPLGYGISFRISSKERRGYPEAVPQKVGGVHYATPYWVRNAGAKGRVSLSRGTEAVYAWSPDWDDPIYLEKLDDFHRVFAERYDGKPWVRYVDVGSIGDYGEGHTSASTKIPPTVEEVKANIDVYVKNYSHSRLVCTDDLLYYDKDSAEVQELYEYAISNGLTLRDDSPMVGWYIKKYMDTWTVSHPHFYDPLYLERPTVFELAHYSSVRRNGYWQGKNGEDTIPSLGVPGAEIFRKAVETMHATWIGYHGYAEEFLRENPDLAGELLNLCGYWYFPVSAEFPSEMRGGEQTIAISWLNRGVAPSYRSFSILFVLEPSGRQGKPHMMVVPDAGNREWLPGKIKHESYTIDLPDRIRKGTYLLKFKLKDTHTKGQQQDVFLGIRASSADTNHCMILGEVEVF